MQLLHTTTEAQSDSQFFRRSLLNTDLVCSFHMDLDNQVPVIVCHVLEADIPQDACVIEQYVYFPKLLDGRIDNAVTILDTVIIRNGFAACCSYFIYYHICGLQKAISCDIQSSMLESPS